MLREILINIQKVTPQHLLSSLIGRLAESRRPTMKNFLIQQFSRFYGVTLADAALGNLNDYLSFNDFFIRQLKADSRPITQLSNEIASPVDGTISEIGQIHQNQLLQAKQFYFDLETLLVNAELAKTFHDGSFATLYLAPHNYHRVHMPIAGKLKKMIYVPGKLFSVNRMTSELIPNLYSRNERVISIFETEAGPMAVILVGAMIVGQIQMAWMDKPARSNQILTEDFDNGYYLNKGGELGYFKLGSTVILLFGKNRISWSPSVHPSKQIEYGQCIGTISS